MSQDDALAQSELARYGIERILAAKRGAKA